MLALTFMSVNDASAITISKLQQQLLQTGLPLVIIETVDGEEPTYEIAVAPPGCLGQGIKNATKVPGRLTILNVKETIYDSGEYEKGGSGMTIKVRGNTSASHANKSFKIKLQNKADLLCRGDKRYKDKDWLLLRVPNLNALIGFKTNEMLGLQWTPSYQLVNVMMNEDYRGVYMLAESVKRNPDCRINVDKNFGYVFELDAYWWNEDVYAESTFAKQSMNYTFKYPDSEDITEAQLNYFREHILKMEASLENGTYSDYIDIPSFANWMLAHDILGNIDGAGSNIFLTKYDSTATSKIMMGPLWDFDHIMKAEQWDRVHTMYYFQQLFNSKDETFRNTYFNRWNDIKDTFFDNLSEYLSHFPQSAEGKGFNSSVSFHNKRWPNNKLQPAETYYDAAESFFSNRALWLDSAIVLTEPSVGNTFTLNSITYRVTSKTPKTVEVSKSKKAGNVVIPDSVTYSEWTYMVTGIASSAFKNANEMTGVKIPVAVRYIGNDAFANCTALADIDLGDLKQLDALRSGTFSQCESLSSVVLAPNLKTIEIAFDGCEHISDIYSSLEEPFAIADNTWHSNTYENATLHIPGGTVKKYQTTEGWKNFKHIVRTAVGVTVTASEGGSVKFSDIILSDSSKLLQMKEDTVLTFVIEPEEEHYLESVLMNGENITDQLVDGTLTITVASEDIELAVTFRAYSWYIVSATAIGGGTILVGINVDKPSAEATDSIMQGRSTTIKMIADEGYELHRVTVNGKDKTAEVVDSVLTLTDIQENLSVIATFRPSSDSITIGEEGMVAYCSDSAMDFGDMEGVKAYIACGFIRKTGTVIMLPVTDIPAHEGIIVKGEPGTYKVPHTQPSAYYRNMLKGNVESANITHTDGTQTNYILTDGEDGHTFYRMKEAGELESNSAVLQIPTTYATDDGGLTLLFIEEPGNKCDVNGDGAINVADIATIISEMAARSRTKQSMEE